MKYYKHTVILTNDDCSGGATARLESANYGTLMTIKGIPSSCLIGIKSRIRPLEVYPSTGRISIIELKYFIDKNDCIEIIITNTDGTKVLFYGNTLSKKVLSSTMLDGFSRYTKADNQKNDYSKVDIPKADIPKADIPKVETSKSIDKQTTTDSKTMQTNRQENRSMNNNTNNNNYNNSSNNNINQANNASNNDKMDTIKKEIASTTDSNIGTTVSDFSPFDMVDSRQQGNNNNSSRNRVPHLSYYNSIKPDIDYLMNHNPHNTELEGLIHDSEWAMVQDDERNSTYYIGVICEDDGTPLYVCYAVFGRKDTSPGKEYNFVPSNKVHGYWIMYQDSSSGDIVMVW